MEGCKGCGSNKLIKNGKNKLGTQRYKCKECGGTFIGGDATTVESCGGLVIASVA